MRLPLVVGFDLDMTLVDSAPGIVATLTTVLDELPEAGPPRDRTPDVWPWIGLPLEDTIASLAPGADVTAAAATYRSRYKSIGAPLTTLLPGATDAIRAVKGAGGRVLVVSAKAQAGVWEVLEQVGLAHGDLTPDLVVGDLFAAAKGGILKQEQASVYVGDHPADVEAARVGDALSVGVATGPRTAADLRAAGADVVLADLTAFGGWLEQALAAQP